MTLLTGTMSGGDVAAVVGSVLGVVVAVALLVFLVSVTRTLQAVRASVEELRRETLPILGELRTTVGSANAELVRVDTLLTSAESISSTVDSASRLAYLAFSNPVIKTLAVG
ncbi:MAG TPA: hypothetical protein VF954_06990, partial [Acidimicrobiales bacterium]